MLKTMVIDPMFKNYTQLSLQYCCGIHNTPLLANSQCGINSKDMLYFIKL